MHDYNIRYSIYWVYAQVMEWVVLPIYRPIHKGAVHVRNYVTLQLQRLYNAITASLTATKDYIVGVIHTTVHKITTTTTASKNYVYEAADVTRIVFNILVRGKKED